MTPEKTRLQSIDNTRAKRLQTLGAGYSSFVTIAKFALPVVALIIIGIVFSNLSTSPLQEQIASIPREENTTPGQVELVKAKYEGADEKGQKYVLTADKATRIDEKQNVVSLEKPRADITLEGGTWLAIHADSGVFNSAGGHLGLSGNVVVFHDAGYELKMETTEISLTGKTVSSDKPVSGHGPIGEIHAQNLSVTDDGMKIVFGGPATLTLRLNQKKVRG